MEIVINVCYGVFGFSDLFEEMFCIRHPTKTLDTHARTTRSDPDVIALIRELGVEKSSGQYASLEFFQVLPELVNYVHIDEYDGLESVEILYDRAHRDLLEKFVLTMDVPMSEIRDRYEHLLELERTQESLNRYLMR